MDGYLYSSILLCTVIYSYTTQSSIVLWNLWDIFVGWVGLAGLGLFIDWFFCGISILFGWLASYNKICRWLSKTSSKYYFNSIDISIFPFHQDNKYHPQNQIIIPKKSKKHKNHPKPHKNVPTIRTQIITQKT